MLSKELFEEIIGEKTLGFNPQPIKTICGESFDYQTPTIMIGRIEVHLFMHMCKEWAFNKEYILYSSKMFSDNEFSYSCFIPDSIIEGTKRWYSITEPETVIKACEWILENE